MAQLHKTLIETAVKGFNSEAFTSPVSQTNISGPEIHNPGPMVNGGADRAVEASNNNLDGLKQEVQSLGIIEMATVAAIKEQSDGPGLSGFMRGEAATIAMAGIASTINPALGMAIGTASLVQTGGQVMAHGLRELMGQGTFVTHDQQGTQYEYMDKEDAELQSTFDMEATSPDDQWDMATVISMSEEELAKDTYDHVADLSPEDQAQFLDFIRDQRERTMMVLDQHELSRTHLALSYEMTYGEELDHHVSAPAPRMG